MANDRVPSIAKDPTWDTWVRKSVGGGKLVARDNSVWLYREVPMGPVVEATSAAAAKSMGDPLAGLFDGLASLASQRGSRRMASGSYREFHLLRLAIPFWFEAPQHLATAAMLNAHYRDRLVLRKMTLVGVRLRPASGAQGFRSAFGSVVDTLVTGQRPLADFDRDFDRVDRIMRQSGFEVPTAETLRVAQSWWTHGQPRAVPVLPHEEHLHFFETVAAKREVERHHDVADCSEWATEVPGQGSVSFLNVQQIDVDGIDPMSPAAPFLAGIEASGVRAVSVRGLVEPAKVTRTELRNRRRAIRGDNADARNAGSDSMAENEEKEQVLDAFERDAATGRLPPTLIDTSIVLAVDGVIDDPDALNLPHLTLTPMTNVQGSAWHETMLASSVYANPARHDLSSHMLAYTGLPDRTIVGEGGWQGPLALLGFSHDLQPIYISPRAAWSTDAEPGMVVPAGTGSGKTVSIGQWLTYQWALQGVPVVFIDPKPGSDLRPFLHAVSGQVATRDVSLDDLSSSDGALDPVRIAKSPEVAVDTAIKVMRQVGPWPGEQFLQLEPMFKRGLAYGIARGAIGTEQALRIAIADGEIDGHELGTLFDLAATTPMLRATFGTGRDEDASMARIGHGLTLFRAGEGGFLTPARGQELMKQESPVRASVNLLRMLIRSSLQALSGRGGVLVLDEAWIIDLVAGDEVEAMGRMARSMGVLFVYMTQTPRKTADNGLTGYFSRGLIGHLRDEDEAKGALDLFKLDHARLLPRVTAKRNLGGGRGVNPMSLRALLQTGPDGSKQMVRPAQFIYSDLESNAAAVTVDIPGPLFDLFQTTPDTPDDETPGLPG